tara:strand:- start:14545 stop:15165 length:621 start_codon:yes stop_codon:yes gene_type:complete
MDLDFSVDFKQLERALSDVMQRQLPFAMMLALNDTAADVKDAEERDLEKTFDRPTPFTKRGVYVKRASKSTLTATVGMKPVQAQYLKLHASGGIRLPKRRALVIGAGLRRNKYGNLPKGAMKRAEAKGDTFVAGKRGGGSQLAPGLYQRGKGARGRGKIKLLVSFEPRAQYKKRLEFQPVALRRARGVYEAHLVRRLKQSQATARK